MRYAKIETFEICNGVNIGCSLYVQGCHFRCPGCFNKEAWEFGGGKEWTEETKDKFLGLIDRPYIKRVSILGGEPLASENLNDVLELIRDIKIKFPDKTIWIFSGYKWSDIINGDQMIIENINADLYHDFILRKFILAIADVFVDGQFEEDKKDLSLEFRGSSNQRVIDVQKSLKEGEIVLWTN